MGSFFIYLLLKAQCKSCGKSTSHLGTTCIKKHMTMHQRRWWEQHFNYSSWQQNILNGLQQPLFFLECCTLYHLFILKEKYIFTFGQVFIAKSYWPLSYKGTQQLFLGGPALVLFSSFFEMHRANTFFFLDLSFSSSFSSRVHSMLMCLIPPPLPHHILIFLLKFA